MTEFFQIPKNEEVFFLISGYEKYQISNYGRVRNIKTKRILKPAMANGYEFVILSQNNKPTKKYIHRLVANAFIKNPLNKPLIDHIDTNKTNNYYENLRYATYSENQRNTNKRNRITSSIYKGVCKLKNGTWKTQITDGKNRIQKYFKTEEQAKNFYNKTAIKLFGGFARTNK